ncbi:MAG: hypothetical protein QNJ16_16450 [Rhodobacter sp.]|nr:hypothetical protein [Rhodobacter sp.]
MKNVLFAAAISLAATSAHAGSYGAPVIEPEVIIEETAASSSNDDWVGVMMAFLTIVVIGIGNN